jgi:hypothetical protein
MPDVKRLRLKGKEGDDTGSLLDTHPSLLGPSRDCRFVKGRGCPATLPRLSIVRNSHGYRGALQ